MNRKEKNVNALLQALGQGCHNVFPASEHGRLEEISGYVADKLPPSGLPQGVMYRSHLESLVCFLKVMLTEESVPRPSSSQGGLHHTSTPA